MVVEKVSSYTYSTELISSTEKVGGVLSSASSGTSNYQSKNKCEVVCCKELTEITTYSKTSTNETTSSSAKKSAATEVSRSSPTTKTKFVLATTEAK